MKRLFNIFKRANKAAALLPEIDSQIQTHKNIASGIVELQSRSAAVRSEIETLKVWAKTLKY